jgi:hypothetical protein
VLIIQVVAAVLLLLGSGLIFKALLEIDAPSRPRRLVRTRLRRAMLEEDDAHLPRAA